MITDEQIRKLSFVIAVIGIVGIAIVSLYTAPEKLTASALTDDKIGRVVEISGTISSFSEKDGHVFLDVADATDSVRVVMFERAARGQKGVYELKKGENVTVTGKVLLYKGELEIQADRIVKS